jgi:hypothetical protein
MMTAAEQRQLRRLTAPIERRVEAAARAQMTPTGRRMQIKAAASSTASSSYPGPRSDETLALGSAAMARSKRADGHHRPTSDPICSSGRASGRACVRASE